MSARSRSGASCLEPRGWHVHRTAAARRLAGLREGSRAGLQFIEEPLSRPHCSRLARPPALRSSGGLRRGQEPVFRCGFATSTGQQVVAYASNHDLRARKLAISVHEVRKCLWLACACSAQNMHPLAVAPQVAWFRCGKLVQWSCRYGAQGAVHASTIICTVCAPPASTCLLCVCVRTLVGRAPLV